MNEIRKIPAGKISGIKTSIFTIMNPDKYDPKAIPTAWQEFFSKLPAAERPSSGIFYGAAVPSMDLNIPMTYIAGTLNDAHSKVLDSFESVEIPEGNYFCYTHKGPITDLAQSYGIAYGSELPKSGYQMRNAPHLEIYESSEDPMSPNYEMVIAIPVA